MHFPNCATIVNQPTPEVGMGATIVYYSDRDACSISRVNKSGKTFWIKKDKAERIDSNGMSDSQQYAYSPDDSEPEIRVNACKDGWRTSGGHKVWVGVRDQHHDFSF